MERYSIVVEPESTVKSKKGKFNVVIKKGGSTVGVPLGGVKEAEAYAACRAIGYAFQYGYEACRGTAKQFLWDTDLEVVLEQPKEGG